MTTTLPKRSSADVHHTSSMREKPKWWLPGSAVAYDTLTSQLESVKKAGFGGVEVAFLGNGGGKPGLREVNKWADQDGKWKRMVQYIWQECERLGITADLTVGPAFPAMVPDLSPNSPGSAKELVHGKSTETYASGDKLDLSVLPEPTSMEAGRTPANPPDQKAQLNMLAVYAVRVVVDGDQLPVKEQGSLVIDVGEDGTYRTSVLEITKQYQNDATFTFPDYKRRNSRWISKSHFEQNADTYTQELAHVVDHLSEDGVRVLAVSSTLSGLLGRESNSFGGVVVYQEYYETHILDEDMKATFKRMGSSLFEGLCDLSTSTIGQIANDVFPPADSLELSQTQYWTPALLQNFRQKRGYDLTPFLPLVLDEAKHHPFAPPFRTFRLSNPDGKGTQQRKSLQDRVRHDFALTVSDLYLEKRLDPLKKWANSIGLALRNQPYGIDFDAAVAATKVDIVEGETLCFWGNDDSFRVLATGRDVAGSKLLSEELAASMHKHYALTWHDIIRMANRDFALGVNQVIMHGLPYPEAEDSEWPGYMPFLPAGKLPGFGDAWGERQPQWPLSSGYTKYLQNIQHILQSGRAIVDIGIYHGATEGVKRGMKDTALSEAGYTYGFPSDGLLARDDAVVKDGKLWSEGPGYKALVLNDVAYMQLSTLARILQLAKNGLPIVLVGNGPVVSAGLNPPQDGSATDDDTETVALLLELRNEPKCLSVDNVGQVSDALKRINVLPSLECIGDFNPFLVAVREDNDHRYYYIHNTSDSGVESSVRINAPAFADPAVLSAWDKNQATIIPHKRTYEGCIDVDIQLSPKGSTIIRLLQSLNQSPDGIPAEQSSSPVVPTISSQIELTEWKLDIESWEPSSTQDAVSAIMNKHNRSVSLKQGLQPWSELEDAEDVSGIAIYEATFENPMNQQGSTSRVVLELGRLDDAYDVTLNDQEVTGVDRLQGRHDITGYLRPGENKLRVMIGTTLNNRMKQAYPEKFEGRATQVHGIKGPVMLVLYNRTMEV
ncbi:hypothetical protein QFC22_001252 [Naganishia vaughanmartiniae]|uniref:Uncharacterized protein n=1 Tax=Naganishia vaughanmartiniae TaxID=1424756 RepID=A0ACC2XHF4_9TREE|nr:hypothetical protein QFC22_001252 [Naganishia vaughanmartiniae]